MSDIKEAVCAPWVQYVCLALWIMSTAEADQQNPLWSDENPERMVWGLMASDVGLTYYVRGKPADPELSKASLLKPGVGQNTQ